MLKKLKPYYNIINSVVVVLLLLIHFVFKEVNHFFSLFFYAFPLPVIILIILCFLFFLIGKQKYFNLIFAFILFMIWLHRSYKINEPDAIIENDVEIVFWNAAHKREFKHVFNEFQSLPDVVVLVEYHAETLEKIKTQYSNSYFYWHDDSEIGVFSKQPVYLEKVLISENESTIINFSTFKINFYAVDVNPSLLIPRKEELAFINQSIQSKHGSVILGDFNLPYESKFFSYIKNSFNHTLTEKGNGFRETWFWNIPLLSLDHIWVSKDLKIITTEKINTWKSDHSMIKTVVRK